ncbi:carbamoyltransferase HypF [Methanobrevibacter sp. DSM 116169]|uniref:carbamoyltransferase HypF n=1 Tax=Methanobrevibacter sp. DSM 116169 TaxID=3242727 RepID=UPI0038FC959D
MKSIKILTEGIVQGVGFRPFVYRLAYKLGLNGYVRNLGNVVEIILQGDNIKIEDFIKELESNIPPIARIDSIKIEDIDIDEFNDFKILESMDKYSGMSTIPSDVSICDNCLEELQNPNDRRYRYPFNACTDCGPRFTLIESVPYDRDKTSMIDFPLCDECLKEYTNPNNRRYHGEAICCPACGPQMELYNNKKEKLDLSDPISKSREYLANGKIIAIKGIGGTHLVCDAYNGEAITKLRKKLGRFNQPFAVMSKDIETVKSFSKISKKEEKTLVSNKRPIVVLSKGENYHFPNSLAPTLHNIGVMLPYSPMHYLLFDNNLDTLVMTSANVPGEPMMITNEEILNLDKIADYFLIHNRRIINRCDDSVIRFRNDELAFIRRSRSYTPEPYKISEKYSLNNSKVLALGPELDVTFALRKENLIYPSQHIGNTNKYKTLEFLKSAINHMIKITKIDEFDIIAHDMHPQFFTTKLANELSDKYSCNTLPVQHHHAHAAALANDHNIDKFIAICADGTGYGSDGTSWGGEVLYTDIKTFKRMGSLASQRMPGGDRSTKYPARMLESILYNNIESDDLEKLMIENYKDYFKHGANEIKNVINQLDKNLNVSTTTSTGRILDSISTALKICGERTYEGECSMKLESVAHNANGTIEIQPIIKKEDNRLILDTNDLVYNVIKLIDKGERIKEIAAASQNTISDGLSEIAIKSADKEKIGTIGLTGGVFYNEAITVRCVQNIKNSGLKVIQHKNTCPGDGSVSLGQAIIASLN